MMRGMDVTKSSISTFQPCYLMKALDRFTECCLKLAHMTEMVILGQFILVISVIQNYVAKSIKKAVRIISCSYLWSFGLGAFGGILILFWVLLLLLLFFHNSKSIR